GQAPAPPSRARAIEPDPRGWASARERMARAILAAASPSREDRLFPGDIAQFKTGGLNLAHGAAGVLYALAATGAGRYPDHEEWLATRAKAPTPGVRLGFYDGLHGVAHALGFLGRREDALAVLEICLDELTGKLAHFSLDLSRGLAGIGLNLAHFWQLTGDAALKDQALVVAQLCADRLGDEDAVATLSGGEHPHAGLIRGSSGTALFFIRLAEAFGDTGWLDLAATALRQDLRRCVTRPEGTLEVNEGWRTMPYLADGSVGIGMVLADYLAHRHDDRFAEAAKGIRLAATCPFTVEPGLFYGKAGMILYLSRGLEPGSGGADPVIAAHIRRLSWHGIDYRGGLAFPGEQLLRLSMDLASGTAGVLLAMGAALHDAPVALPFLSPGGTARHQQTIDIRQAALARLATSAERR
ncbi:MAG TPA: lantipeptide synthetase, partial [Actinomycetota bacterium]|nr:lantipeptide synthetase [Actinomycetota bacterium]